MADVYISPTGNDTTGTGTSGLPWLTISKAVTSSASGDTIHCGAGTYTWVSQAFASARTIVGDAGAAATIFDGASGNVNWGADISLAISDLTFQNANRNSFPSLFDNTGTAVMSFTNCIFKNLTSTANRSIFGKDGSTTNGGSITMIGCLMNNFSATGGAGYFGTNASTMSFVVYNCTFYSNVAAGNTLGFYRNDGGGSPAANFDIRNCIVVNDNGVNQAWHALGAVASRILARWRPATMSLAILRCQLA